MTINGAFVSPHLIDLVLLFTILEAVFLIASRRTSARGPRRVRQIVLLLLPGVCLMLAIRAVLSGEAWPWMPAALLAALLAHVADLRERWWR